MQKIQSSTSLMWSTVSTTNLGTYSFCLSACTFVVKMEKEFNFGETEKSTESELFSNCLYKLKPKTFKLHILSGKIGLT